MSMGLREIFHKNHIYVDGVCDTDKFVVVPLNKTIADIRALMVEVVGEEHTYKPHSFHKVVMGWTCAKCGIQIRNKDCPHNQHRAECLNRLEKV